MAVIKDNASHSQEVVPSVDRRRWRRQRISPIVDPPSIMFPEALLAIIVFRNKIAICNENSNDFIPIHAYDRPIVAHCKKLFHKMLKHFTVYLRNLAREMRTYMGQILAGIKDDASVEGWCRLLTGGLVVVRKHEGKIDLVLLNSEPGFHDEELELIVFERNMKKIREHLNDKIRRRLHRRCVLKRSFREELDRWNSLIHFLEQNRIVFGDDGYLDCVDDFLKYVSYHIKNQPGDVHDVVAVIEREQYYSKHKGYISSMLHRYYKRLLIKLWDKMQPLMSLLNLYPNITLSKRIKKGRTKSLLYFAIQVIIRMYLDKAGFVSTENGTIHKRSICWCQACMKDLFKGVHLLEGA